MTGHDGSMTTIHAEDAELALGPVDPVRDGESALCRNEKMARRIVEQAIHVVVHLANQDGRRRVTGILAVERGGNHKWVYRQASFGGWERMTDLIGNSRDWLPGCAPTSGRGGATPVTALAVVAQLPVLLVVVSWCAGLRLRRLRGHPRRGSPAPETLPGSADLGSRAGERT